MIVVFCRCSVAVEGDAGSVAWLSRGDVLPRRTAAAEYEDRHVVAVITPVLAAELVGSEGPDVALSITGAVSALRAVG